MWRMLLKATKYKKDFLPSSVAQKLKKKIVNIEITYFNFGALVCYNITFVATCEKKNQNKHMNSKKNIEKSTMRSFLRTFCGRPKPKLLKCEPIIEVLIKLKILSKILPPLPSLEKNQIIHLVQVQVLRKSFFFFFLSVSSSG